MMDLIITDFVGIFPTEIAFSPTESGWFLCKRVRQACCHCLGLSEYFLNTRYFEQQENIQKHWNINLGMELDFPGVNILQNTQKPAEEETVIGQVELFTYQTILTNATLSKDSYFVSQWWSMKKLYFHVFEKK